MNQLERTVEEKASAKRRAKHYIEDHRISKWAAISQALILFTVIVSAAFAIAYYALGVGIRDNTNYKRELGQLPVIEHDRGVKAYDEMKARYGLK